MISDAEVAEIPFSAFGSQRRADQIDARLIVRRVKRLNPASVPPGQQELFSTWRHHAVFTDNPMPLLDAETCHRQHAVIEQVIADLKNGALAHLPRASSPPTPPGSSWPRWPSTCNAPRAASPRPGTPAPPPRRSAGT